MWIATIIQLVGLIMITVAVGVLAGFPWGLLAAGGGTLAVGVALERGVGPGRADHAG